MDMAKTTEEQFAALHGRFIVKTTTASEPIANPERPTHGRIQFLATVPDGEAWPQVRYRVHGMHGRSECILRRDGSWWWVAERDRGTAFIVPRECQLTQAELGDALGAAGVGAGLPMHLEGWQQPAPITYVDAAIRPAQALREDFKPKAPKWRGGKPWV
jgi:hypothetical protein